MTVGVNNPAYGYQFTSSYILEGKKTPELCDNAINAVFNIHR